MTAVSGSGPAYAFLLAECMGEAGRQAGLPAELADRLALSADGMELGYDYDTRAERTGIARLLAELTQHGIAVRDVATKQSNLEEIFMSLVEDRQEASA